MWSLLIWLGLLTFSNSSFLFPTPNPYVPHKTKRALGVSMRPYVVEPSQRDEKYGDNVAQYLLDLHDNRGTFDFCGGMMFQLMLSDKLYEYLKKVATGKEGEQPVIFDSSKVRMFQLPGYAKSSQADNIRIFHGRELRKIPKAAGGYGFVLQLSLANSDDPEGWSPQEISTYDGWAHDVGRQWRKAQDYDREGFENFIQKFGSNAFGLNHRFYLHYDSSQRLWLSAEDGCEGTPAESGITGTFGRLFGF
mmetsp:Transcript_350/g.591  ORF Transcript_350/g.591 Transcript_350/m.591 type:complete len:249 (+) Transcript_350:117-863(+)